jgi:hypothetical protein
MSQIVAHRSRPASSDFFKRFGNAAPIIVKQTNRSAQSKRD